MKRSVILVAAGLLLLGIGLGGGVFWGKRQVARVQEDFRKDFQQLRQRVEVAQRRGADERTRAEQAQRLKYEVEQNLEKSKEELLRKEQAVGSSQLETDKLRKTIANLQEQAALDKANITQLQVNYQQLQSQLARLNEEQKSVQSQFEEAKSRLQYSSQQFDRCKAHNVELAKAAGDLLDAYENKGVFRALLEKEPVTGLGKVEAEHLLQEYSRKVDQNVLSQKGR